MRYNLTEPCDACPFLLGSGFAWKRLVAFASGEFPCHKACKIVESEHMGAAVDAYVPRSEKTPHCAGALIFLEKQEKSHQMMRICERLGLYDYRKLNMNARVGSGPLDYPTRRAPR